MKGEIISPVPKEVILYPRGCKEKLPYVNEECEFTPCGWTRIGDCYFPLGYKVVDLSMRSLGLRKNPNIMTFPVGEWVILPDEETKVGADDWGGIWTALKKGSIKTLQNYCLEKYQMETRAFLTAMYRPVYANSYRIKSQGVLLIDQIH